MSDLEKAIATQLANIEKRSGKSLNELAAIIRASGLAKHAVNLFGKQMRAKSLFAT